MREVKFRCWDFAEKKMYYEDCNCKCRNAPIMQYTGLKDNRDTEWAEGELITDGNNIMIIHFHCGGYQCYSDELYQNHCYDILEALARRCWSVGNIYENPELLEIGD